MLGAYSIWNRIPLKGCERGSERDVGFRAIPAKQQRIHRAWDVLGSHKAFSRCSS